MKIALLGDIAFFGKFSMNNNANLFEYFKIISNKLSSYDLVIGNLETPFVEEGVKPYGFKSAYIKSSPQNVELLKYLNIDVVNLANNHIYDYGKKGYELTKSLLKKNDIKYFGIENNQLTINFDNNKLALNGFCCYSTNPLGLDIKGINALNTNSAEKILIENSEKKMFNIFSVHCGQEHVNYPNYDHIRLARQLANISPYVFYGHHPHVAQGVEKVNESLIAYSLGNFCFDDVYTNKSKDPLIKQTENNKESFILELEVENNVLIDYQIIPIYMGEKEMIVGSLDISGKINHYSKILNLEKMEYRFKRDVLLNSYIAERKNKRDFLWYLKRLNYKSFFLIVSALLNSKKYKKNILRQLN